MVRITASLEYCILGSTCWGNFDPDLRNVVNTNIKFTYALDINIKFTYVMDINIKFTYAVDIIKLESRTAGFSKQT